MFGSLLIMCDGFMVNYIFVPLTCMGLSKSLNSFKYECFAYFLFQNEILSVFENEGVFYVNN